MDYKIIIEHYGKEMQKIVAIEELAELQKEITKDLRGKTNETGLIEEIADVEIMLEQLKAMYEIDKDQLEKIKELKIQRTLERMLYGN